MKIVDNFNKKVINLDIFDDIKIRTYAGSTEITANRYGGGGDCLCSITIKFSTNKEEMEWLYEKLKTAWINGDKSFELN
jgi:hypothetical protein